MTNQNTQHADLQHMLDHAIEMAGEIIEEARRRSVLAGLIVCQMDDETAEFGAVEILDERLRDNAQMHRLVSKLEAIKTAVA